MLGRRRLLSAGVGAAAVALSGCATNGADGIGPADGADDDGSPTPEPGLQVPVLAFCADEPEGYDQFERQPDATYPPDATVWIYLEVDGVGTQETEEGVHIDLRENVLVTDADGATIIDDTLRYDQTFEPGTDLDTFFVTNKVTLPSNPATGEYEFTAEFVDEIGDAETRATGTFTVEG